MVILRDDQMKISKKTKNIMFLLFSSYHIYHYGKDEFDIKSVLRGHNWVLLATVYRYYEFKLRYLKNLKLFSIR